ncbi:MAG TPA: septum formation family protein [Nocardioides sp.]|nr:septum formation family protein [Nocardioides sp.]
MPGRHGEEGAADHTVECGEEHDVEVTWSIAFEGGGPYPGWRRIQAAVSDCDGKAFTDYVGRPLSRSGLASFALAITPEEWEKGRRRVVCLIHDPRGSMTGTLRGADR